MPHAAVLGGAVHEPQRRPFADALVGDLEPVRTNDLHRLNLQAGWGSRATGCHRERSAAGRFGYSRRAGVSTSIPRLSSRTTCSRRASAPSSLPLTRDWNTLMRDRFGREAPAGAPPRPGGGCRSVRIAAQRRLPRLHPADAPPASEENAF